MEKFCHRHRYHIQIHDQGRIEVEEIEIGHLTLQNKITALDIDRLIGAYGQLVQKPIWKLSTEDG
ncbi:MAG: hypothetical protein BWY75_03818 [bacterium ADurb.Bin425]|nr:MAG: hypothetical protein BWY75_03818 [bacterium ADurb.Bin425]